MEKSVLEEFVVSVGPTMWGADNIVSATRPVWILGQLVGLGYRSPGEKVNKESPKPYVKVLRILYVWVVFITVVITNVLIVRGLSIPTKHLVVETVHVLFNISNMFTSLTTSILQLSRQSELIRVIKDINDVDVKLKRFPLWNSYRKIKVVSLILTSVCVMTILASLSLYMSVCINSDCVRYSLMITVIQTVISVNFVTFIVHMAVIWQKLSIVNENLKQISKDESSVSVSLFKEIGRIRAISSLQIIYLDILDISGRLNRIYDVFLVLALLTQAITIFAFWYFFFFISTLKNNFFNPGMLQCSYISNAICVSQLFVICMTCQNTGFQSRHTRKLMFQLPISRFNKTLLKKINQFSIRMTHQEFSITAHGFFNIDYTLLLTVAGAVAVYLVMFIQFDLASSNGKEISNVSHSRC